MLSIATLHTTTVSDFWGEKWKPDWKVWFTLCRQANKSLNFAQLCEPTSLKWKPWGRSPVESLVFGIWPLTACSHVHVTAWCCNHQVKNRHVWRASKISISKATHSSHAFPLVSMTCHYLQKVKGKKGPDTSLVLTSRHSMLVDFALLLLCTTAKPKDPAGKGRESVTSLFVTRKTG